MSDRAFHLSLNVADIGRSVAFYRSLLGVEPAKAFHDYAKFELAEPALVLSLEPSRGATNGGALNHLGVRVKGPEQIREYYERVAAAGIETQWIAGVECCYSRQSKIVTNDPDGNLVEVYIVEEDLDRPAAPAGAASATANAAAAEAKSHTHMLGTGFDLPVALADSAVEQFNLRGTFNAPGSYEQRGRILAEAARALRPGGELTCHLLVADKPVAKAMPTLPAPAQHVTFVPVATSVLAAVEEAGFIDLQIARLSHSAVMVFDGVEMRELYLTARKPEAAGLGERRAVVYKGPMRQLVDDQGVVYKRGEPVMVDSATWQRLQAGAASDSLVFLSGADQQACHRD